MTQNIFTHAAVLRVIVVPLTCLFLATVATSPADAATLRACTKFQLDRAISQARPGDVVEMCDGRWDDAIINFDVKGTRSAPITLKAQSPGGVELRGSSQVYVGGDFAIVDGLKFVGRYRGVADAMVEFRSLGGQLCFDCRVTNLTFDGYNPSRSDVLTRWVVLHGKRNRVDHSHFRGKTNLGAMIQLRRGADQSPNNHRIDHNLLENRPNFTGEGNQNGDTLEIGETGKYAYGTSGSTIEFNYLLNIDSDFEVVTIKSSGNTVRYNVLDGSRGVLSLRNGSDNVVHGNYILGRGKEGTGGIKVRGKGHTVSSNYIYDINPMTNNALAGVVLADGSNETLNPGGDNARPYLKFERADNVRVLHNTIVEAGVAMSIGNSDPLPPRNIEILNNIYVQDAGEAIAPVHMGSNIRFSNNLFSGAEAGINDAGVQAVDPRLVVDAAGIRRPAAQSPAINTAIATADADFDMDGQRRQSPQDIGADEVIAGQTPRGPVQLCEVGPTTYRMGLPSSCDTVRAAGPRPMPPSLLSVE